MKKMQKISWEQFFQRLDQIEFPKSDLIVAIARGGIIPAAFIQQKLNIPMQIIQINYRDDDHNPQHEDARLLESSDFQINNQKILLIDDVSRTGKTLNKAKEYLKGNQIETCLVNGKGDHSLFQSDSCLKMPWKQ